MYVFLSSICLFLTASEITNAPAEMATHKKSPFQISNAMECKSLTYAKLF